MIRIGVMKAGAPTDNPFQIDAAKYAAYLQTPEGRVRLDAAFANLREFLPDNTASLRALDIGGGTGDLAVRLARLGVYVTILDSSPEMLNFAEHAAIEAGVAEKIALKRGNAAQLDSFFQHRSFDLVICHNVLEYMDDPAVVLRVAARLLRDPLSILSVLVRSQTGEVLKAAVQRGDLAGAEDALTSGWGQESLCGGKVRLFTLDALRRMLEDASFRIVSERGVRVITDYLPPQSPRSESYERILELERKLGARAEFIAAARYIHTLARLRVF